MKKLNILFDFLYEEYINKKKSMKEIAIELNTTTMTIYNRLKEYNIPRRDTACWRGKKRPEHSKIMKGRKNSAVSVANKNRTGENALNFIDGRTLINHYCSICDKRIEYKTWKDGIGHCKSCANRINMTDKLRTKETKQKMSILMSGKNNPNFGKPMKPKFVQYNNIWFRSYWEVKYAKYLDREKIKWLYESKTFDLVDTTYTPDFYLPKTKEYIEIKGYLTTIAKNKINLFRKIYSEVNFKVLFEKDLQKIGVIS